MFISIFGLSEEKGLLIGTIRRKKFAQSKSSLLLLEYNKICVKRPLKNRQNKDLNDKR